MRAILSGGSPRNMPEFDIDIPNADVCGWTTVCPMPVAEIFVYAVSNPDLFRNPKPQIYFAPRCEEHAYESRKNLNDWPSYPFITIPVST